MALAQTWQKQSQANYDVTRFKSVVSLFFRILAEMRFHAKILSKDTETQNVIEIACVISVKILHLLDFLGIFFCCCAGAIQVWFKM